MRRRGLLLVVLLAHLALFLPAQAQFDAGLSDGNLETFFQWFNNIFQPLLPIALLGAGIVAGATFLYIIVSVIARVFGRGGAADDGLEFVDPFNPDGSDYREYAALQREDGKTPISESAWNEYYRRREILDDIRRKSGKYDGKREFVYGLDKERRIKLRPWERQYLLGTGRFSSNEVESLTRKDRALYRRELREGILFYNDSKGAQWVDPPMPKQKKGKKGKRNEFDDIFAPMLDGVSGKRGKKGRQQFDLFSPDTFGGGRRGRDDFSVMGRPPSVGRSSRNNSVMDFVFFGDSTPRRRRRR